MIKLSDSRRMIKNYTGKLSSQGYFISVDDKNKVLPDGTIIDSGV